MSTLLADPVRVSHRGNPSRPLPNREGRSAVDGGITPSASSTTRKRSNRTGPRVGPRGRSASPRRGGVSAPSVVNPLPLREALAIGNTDVAVPRTRLVVAPVGYRLTDRGIAVITTLLIALVCVASLTAAVRFVSVTAEAGPASSVSTSAQMVRPTVPDAPRA